MLSPTPVTKMIALMRDVVKSRGVGGKLRVNALIDRFEYQDAQDGNYERINSLFIDQYPTFNYECLKPVERKAVDACIASLKRTHLPEGFELIDSGILRDHHRVVTGKQVQDRIDEMLRENAAASSKTVREMVEHYRQATTGDGLDEATLDAFMTNKKRLQIPRYHAPQYTYKPPREDSGQPLTPLEKLAAPLELVSNIDSNRAYKESRDPGRLDVATLINELQILAEETQDYSHLNDLSPVEFRMTNFKALKQEERKAITDVVSSLEQILLHDFALTGNTTIGGHSIDGASMYVRLMNVLKEQAASSPRLLQHIMAMHRQAEGSPERLYEAVVDEISDALVKPSPEAREASLARITNRTYPEYTPAPREPRERGKNMPRHEKVALGLSALLATGMAIYSVRDKPADKFPVPPVDDVPNMLEPTTRPHADRVDVASRIKRENARSPTTKPERG